MISKHLYRGTDISNYRDRGLYRTHKNTLEVDMYGNRDNTDG